MLFSILAVADAGEHETQYSESIIAAFDVKPNGDAVTLPVRIAEKQYPFMVATGCTHWLFDNSLRGVLSGSDGNIDLFTPVGQVSVPRYRIARCLVGPLATDSGSRAVCAAIHDSLVPAGQDIYGAIGFEFLRDKVVRIDFDRGRLFILKTASAKCGEQHRIQFDPTAAGPPGPYLMVHLPDGPEWFLLDTGFCSFCSGSIQHDRFMRLASDGHLSPIVRSDDKAFTVFTAEVKRRSAEIKSLSVGNYEHAGLVFDDASISCLGLAFLSRYTVTFDFPNRTVYLRPGRQHQRAEEFGLSGITVVRWKGKTLLADVEAGSPGDVGGIKAMDELIAVDETSADRLSVFEICRKLAQPGRRSLRIIRDGETKDAIITLYAM